jgi:hypothetical protein
MKYKEDIVQMLFKAYFDARKHKRNKHSQLHFERQLETNIFELYNEIKNRTYKIGESICFVINKPVKREIFASSFRDRVIHHFIFNILNPFVEKELLHDIYSCRIGKGTLFGIKRAQSQMQSCSINYTTDTYVLKLDISGYFMNMNKELLYHKVEQIIDKYELNLPIQSSLLKYLVGLNIFHDPTTFCKFQSNESMWSDLPKNKSLFHTAPNCGLPIGNLTSQLYGNLYLNDFDHYVKKELKLKHYGRYVDDFYLFGNNITTLKIAIEKIKHRLTEQERLNLHPNKIYLQHINKGFSFLGVYILPYRRYIGKRIKAGLYRTLSNLNSSIYSDNVNELQRLQSYKSMLTHHNCQNYLKKIEFLEEYSQNKIAIL